MGYLVRGRVRRAGSALRINVRLVRATDGSQLWVESFDGSTHGGLELQSAIAGRVAASLAPELVPAWEVTRRPPAAARDAYLRGRYALNRHTGTQEESRATAQTAFVLFEQALAADPEHARSLAKALLRRGGADADVPRARAALLRAIEIEPSLAEAHTALGDVRLYLEWDWEGARQAYETARTLAPGQAEVYHSYASYFLVQGEIEQALAQIERALELDPVSPAVKGDVGWLYLVARRYPEAVEQCRRALQLEPDSRAARRCLLAAQRKRGQLREARQRAVEIMEIESAEPAAVAAAKAGAPEAGLAAYGRWKLDSLRLRSRREHVHPASFALAYAELGDIEGAVAQLEAAEREPYCSFLPFIGVDPRLDGLREHPRFFALAERIGVPRPPVADRSTGAAR